MSSRCAIANAPGIESI